MIHATNKGHIIQLDGLRFIAVALVLIEHLKEGWVSLGPLGVTIFFVLSGFLISRILLKSKDKLAGQPDAFKKYLSKFLIRRTIRIFPVYYLCLFVVYIFNAPTRFPQFAWFDEPALREHLAWLLLYGTNIYMAIHQTWMGSVDHLWSLAVEEQVYLFFPLLIFFVPRKSLPRWFLIMGIFAVLLRTFFFFSGKTWVVSYVTMPACLDAFAIGGFMAWLQVYKSEAFESVFSKTWPVVVGLLSWVALQYWTHNFNELKYNVGNVILDRLVSSIFCFFLIGRGVMGYTGAMRSFLENPASMYLGKISYGIYLYHNFVYNHYHSGPHHPTVRLLNKIYQYIPELRDFAAFQFVVVVGLTILVASVSWHFFEKPINALKDKYAY